MVQKHLLMDRPTTFFVTALSILVLTACEPAQQVTSAPEAVALVRAKDKAPGLLPAALRAERRGKYWMVAGGAPDSQFVAFVDARTGKVASVYAHPVVNVALVNPSDK